MNRIKYYRIKKGYDQTELAAKLGVSRFLLQSFESDKYKGAMKEDKLRRLAEILGVDNFFELYNSKDAIRILPRNDKELVEFVHGMATLTENEELKTRLEKF